MATPRFWKGSMYQSNLLDAVKYSLIITVKAYDTTGEEIDLNTEFVVCISLTNNYQLNWAWIVGNHKAYDKQILPILEHNSWLNTQ